MAQVIDTDDERRSLRRQSQQARPARCELVADDISDDLNRHDLPALTCQFQFLERSVSGLASALGLVNIQLARVTNRRLSGLLLPPVGDVSSIKLPRLALAPALYDRTTPFYPGVNRRQRNAKDRRKIGAVYALTHLNKNPVRMFL